MARRPARRVAGRDRGRVDRPARGLPVRDPQQSSGSPTSRVVVDPFHVVRLANQAVTRCRQRVQQEQLGHRGWASDPLYAIRKLLLLGAERLDDEAWERIHFALREGDPDDAARRRVDRARRRSATCIAPTTSKLPRLRSTTRSPGAPHPKPDPNSAASPRRLRRWRSEILAHHTTGASNGPVEAANLMIKQVKRSGRGFRNFANYRLRILLAGSPPRRHSPRHETPSPTQLSRVGPPNLDRGSPFHPEQIQESGAIRPTTHLHQEPSIEVSDARIAPG